MSHKLKLSKEVCTRICILRINFYGIFLRECLIKYLLLTSPEWFKKMQ